MPFSEKEPVDVATPEDRTDNETTFRETAWLSRGIEKDHGSAEKSQCKVPAFIAFLQDGQRYEEPDESLYLGKEEYFQSLGYSEELEPSVGGENHRAPADIIYKYREASAQSGTSGSPDGGQTEEPEEEGKMGERKKIFRHVLSCLNMDRNRKLLPDNVEPFSQGSGGRRTPSTRGDLVWDFLIKVRALDVTARDPISRQRTPDEEREGQPLNDSENLEMQDLQAIDPLDVLCASLLCSDSSLQRQVLWSMYQCQYALPLLLPDAEGTKSIFLLGALGAVLGEQRTRCSEEPRGDPEMPFLLPRMPVISFVRSGHCSLPKSRILNALLSPAEPKSHEVFLCRDSPARVPPRRISDGLVEVAWRFPARNPLDGGNPHFPPGPVALANLHGALESPGPQFGFLMAVSSAVFIFTDRFGEQEGNSFSRLGNSIERCCFVLGPRARGSEEARVFQRILNLKASQLLFWEEEEAEEAGKNVEGLRAALRRVLSSSPPCVSLDSMAVLARELGIQVDQDFDNVPGVQALPNENSTETAQMAGQARLRALGSWSEQSAGERGTEPGIKHELGPGVTPRPGHTSPPPTVDGGNLDQASWKARWATAPHFWSEQRSEWFCPSPFRKERDHSRGEALGTKYSQPQRFCSPERVLKCLRTAWGHHTNGVRGKSPRPIAQRVQAPPERPQSREAHWGPRAGVAQIGHSRCQGSQMAGAAGKPQPTQARSQGTQLIRATGRLLAASSFNTHPHLPAGATHKPRSLASGQGDRLQARGETSNLAFPVGAQPSPHSQFVPSFQLKPSHPKPSQVNRPQSDPSRHLPPHPNSSQSKLTKPQSSQTECSPPRVSLSKSCHAEFSKYKPSQPQPLHSKPQPQPLQSKPQSQPLQSKPQPQPLQSKPQPQSLRCKPPQPQPSHYKPSQTQYFPSKSSQSQWPQPKLSQLHPSQHTSSQARSFQHRPQHQDSQSKSFPFHGPQPKASHSCISQHKLSQHKPAQPKAAWTGASQAKAHPRAGPKRAGKH